MDYIFREKQLFLGVFHPIASSYTNLMKGLHHTHHVVEDYDGLALA